MVMAHLLSPNFCLQKKKILKAAAEGTARQFYLYHFLPEDMYTQGEGPNRRIKVYAKRKRSRPPQAYLAALPALGAPNVARLVADRRAGLADDEEWVAPDRSMAGVRESLEHRGPRGAGSAEERALRARGQATNVARATAAGHSGSASSRRHLGQAFFAGDREAAEQIRQANAKTAKAEAEAEALRERAELAERAAERAENAAPISAERLYNSEFMQSRLNVQTGVESYDVWRCLIGMMRIEYPAGYRSYVNYTSGDMEAMALDTQHAYEQHVPTAPGHRIEREAVAAAIRGNFGHEAQHTQRALRARLVQVQRAGAGAADESEPEGDGAQMEEEEDEESEAGSNR